MERHFSRNYRSEAHPKPCFPSLRFYLSLAGIMYNFEDWWVPKSLQRYKVTP